LPDLFYCRRVLRLHCDKSIGDHITEKQRGPRAFAKIDPFFCPNELFPVYRAQFVERGENFIRQRDHDIFHFLVLLYVNMLGRWRGLRAEPYHCECKPRPLVNFKC
jgi:hypothetical protein